jgi:anti-sigma B factor antagonist
VSEAGPSSRATQGGATSGSEGERPRSGAEGLSSQQLPGAVTLLRLQGEHDLYSAPEVRAELEAALAVGSALVVDLRGASFLDSAVIGALLEARKAARRQQLELALLLSSAPENQVRRTFEQIGLESVFSLYESEQAAISACRAGSTTTG